MFPKGLLCLLFLIVEQCLWYWWIRVDLQRAGLQIQARASHRMNKNRKWISVCFFFFATFFQNNLNIYKGRAAPMFTMLQHTALGCIPAKNEAGMVSERETEPCDFWLSVPPIKAWVVVKRTTWNRFLKTHHEKDVAGRLATSLINTCTFSTPPVVLGSQAQGRKQDKTDSSLKTKKNLYWTKCLRENPSELDSTLLPQH